MCDRKGFHSINAQLVFDAFDTIIDVVARWPGSSHDSRILQNSGVRQLFEEGIIPVGYHLLGDSGYPSRIWLFTPYANPQAGQQTRYNRAHKITRANIERGIGQLKRRFGILHGEIRMKPEKACRVITACAVLHNICKRQNIPLPDVEMEENDDNQPEPNQPDPMENGPQMGLRYRDFFVNTYF
ncbi:hypothetical protein DPMN_010169 [Dreissena polymorpha]|uniref:DDE Tnp4 domain-containing protein n=1 Tax=Dreissena polymorpha TaxID=45954 RepID=A0A9D4S0T0_DREPO|nr:hypothetical protein DPMN_010169 [Dreissena polymorpha]